MPQLDKVTLFSQVFWLMLLYFLFFLYFLKYYLPNFSKLFKVRNYYILATTKNDIFVSSELLSTSFLPLLTRFNLSVDRVWVAVLEMYAKTIGLYNKVFLKGAHEIFKIVYIFNCLKFSFFKTLGFFLPNGIQAN